MCAAALSQVADVAGAYFTGAIAVHTFTSLVLKFRLPMWFVLGTVVCGWVVSIIIGTHRLSALETSIHHDPAPL